MRRIKGTYDPKNSKDGKLILCEYSTTGCPIQKDSCYIETLEGDMIDEQCEYFHKHKDNLDNAVIIYCKYPK